MAGKTQLFHSLRQLYQILGIYSSETNQTHLFNWRVIFVTSSMILAFITSFAFFLWEAETIDDYGTSFYGSITQLCSVHNFLTIVWKMPLILELFRKFETFIESSKLFYLIQLIFFFIEQNEFIKYQSIQDQTIRFRDTFTRNQRRWLSECIDYSIFLLWKRLLSESWYHHYLIRLSIISFMIWKMNPF